MPRSRSRPARSTASRSYAGVPLLFDAGDHATVDTVRITWPNGLIQNETKQATERGVHLSRKRSDFPVPAP